VDCRITWEDNTKMGLMKKCWEDVDCKFRWEDNIKMSPKDKI